VLSSKTKATLCDHLRMRNCCENWRREAEKINMQPRHPWLTECLSVLSFSALPLAPQDWGLWMATWSPLWRLWAPWRLMRLDKHCSGECCLGWFGCHLHLRVGQLASCGCRRTGQCAQRARRGGPLASPHRFG
jgi:hypothetical protein